MKFSIQGFSQRKLVDLGLDHTDALLLRYFIDFKDSGGMLTEIFDDEIYYWINYKKLITELPILKLTKADSVYRRFKKMVEVNVLKHKTKREGGIYSFYNIGKEYLGLISDSTDINPEPYGYKSRTHTDINPEPYGYKSRTKNSSIKYSSINNSSIKDIYTNVINYLNEKAGTNYKTTTKKTQNLIKSRVNENFELKDFFKVIDNKTVEWLNTDMEMYLRPETLFGTKFEGYLNQKVIVNRKDANQNDGAFSNRQQRDYSEFGGINEIEKRLLGFKEDE